MVNHFLEPMEMQPVSGGSVVDRIIHQIRNCIINGRFRMGDKLPTEFELMEELHVSRNSLREAIRVLTTMGVVEVKRGDGTYFCTEIKPSSMDFVVYSMMVGGSSAREIVELRQTLDEDVMTLAMKQVTPEDIAQLEEYILRMRYEFGRGEIRRAAQADYQFHLALAHCSHNRFLERVVAGVYSMFESSIERNIRTEEQFARADGHHQDIVDCLKEKDVSRIPTVVANSLSSWRVNVEKNIT